MLEKIKWLMLNKENSIPAKARQKRFFMIVVCKKLHKLL